MKTQLTKLAVAVVVAFWSVAGASAQQGAPLSPRQQFEQRPRFEYSTLQLHAFPSYTDPDNHHIFKLMFDRISTFRYGDDYFFLGLNSRYDEDWSVRTQTLYYKFAGNLSLDRIFDRKIMPVGFLGGTFLSLQTNSGDLPYLRTVYMAGPAFDVTGLPNFGFLRFYFLVRKEDSMNTTHQVTMIWMQPFRTAKLQWVFNGWGAHWDNNDTNDVIKIEPQLRLRLSSFLGEKNFLHGVILGAEVEFSHHYLFDQHTYEVLGWAGRPSVFVAMPF